MTPDEKLELLDKTLARLNLGIVVVEGKRDAAALQQLGVRSKIVQAAGQDVNRVALRIAGLAPNGAVAVVTDFDEEGRRLNRSLLDALMAANLRATDLLAVHLRDALEFVSVEDALTALARVQEEANAKRA
jgi:5S rRNA maturation endonuclease (ribonuclease M5)